jgi:hypothetical protein
MASSLDRLRADSLSLFEAAREISQYEIAYHALCSALHAGEALADSDTCTIVEERAIQCRDWIDAHAPGHKVSTRSAQSRGNESIFKQLAVMAASARLRLEADAANRKKKGRPKAPLGRSEAT